MASQKQRNDSIALTGNVIDWNVPAVDEEIIGEAVRDAYEAAGWSVTELGGQLYAFKDSKHDDGDVTIQAKLDAAGKHAVSGGHANLGYSGYFRGYVFQNGIRRTLVDFASLFPEREHAYAAQNQKAGAKAAIVEKVSNLAGTQVHKVKGGYRFGPARGRGLMIEQIDLL